MSAYSEMDLERQYSDDPFALDEDFSGLETPVERQEPVPPVEEEGSPQEPEAPPAQDSEKKNEADDAEEEAKRKAHEEAEAKRKAEWEARQQEKKAAVQAQLDRLAAMSDSEVTAASAQRVSADTEKLTRRNMKDCVAEHIQTLCLSDPAFARKTMDPRKNMVNCFRYINRKAWDYVQDEIKASGITPGPGNQAYSCDVPDDLCYQWAEDYFNDPDAKEDQVEEEFVPKPYYGKPTKAPKKSRTKKESAAKKPAAKKPAKDSEQITFGAFTMPEEKAG